MNQKVVDKWVSATITEGYLEAAYSFFEQDRVPDFHMPRSDAWYIKAALREMFPGLPLPTALEIEGHLVRLGVIKSQGIGSKDPFPPGHCWPPKSVTRIETPEHLRLENYAGSEKNAD